MTGGQKRRLKAMIDDYRDAGFSNEQIERAVRHEAVMISPPSIDVQELDELLGEEGII
jgi:hypothetical protein